MAVTIFYFFVWYCLYLNPWCYAARSAGSQVLGHHPPEHPHAEEPRVVYLTFHRREDITVPNPHTGIPLHMVAATIELAHDKTIEGSTTQLLIGRVLGHRSQMFTPIMAERGAVIHGHAYADLGRPFRQSPRYTTITFRLGTTTKRNADIINPHTGAGIWVDTLAPNPQISSRNTFVNIWATLMEKLMPDPVMDNMHHDEGNRLQLQAMVNYLEQINTLQHLQQDFSSFPVPMVIHQQTGPPHPDHWLEDDVMYNVLNVHRPFRIELSHNHANALSLVQHLDEGEVVPNDRSPGEVTGPRRPGHRR